MGARAPPSRLLISGHKRSSIHRGNQKVTILIQCSDLVPLMPGQHCLVMQGNTKYSILFPKYIFSFELESNWGFRVCTKHKSQDKWDLKEASTLIQKVGYFTG